MAAIGAVLLSGCGGTDDARLATFVGHWWGRSRGIDVYRSGRGREHIGPGAPPIATLTFDVLQVSGTPALAEAQIRVTSVRIAERGAFFGLVPHRGQVGTLRLRHGIVTDSVTRVSYCAPAIDECDPLSGVDSDADPSVA